MVSAVFRAIYLVLLACPFIVFNVTAKAALKSEHMTLANGMEVVVIPNTKAPAVSHTIWYKAGAIDEHYGKAGIAHFLEHLMFKGTQSFPEGTFSRTVSRAGGDDNAFTTFDYTGYYENVPKEKLELVMHMESDRMQNLILTEANVKKEREVIIEERRTRVDNEPQNQLFEQMKAALFLNHPYRRPLIGWQHEMAELSLDDARNWYNMYYKPNNAILVVSGDITMAELKPLAEKHYGSLPKGDIPPRLHSQEPPHIAPRTVRLTDERVANNEFYRYYIAPSQVYGQSKHAYALTVLSSLIGSGQTSALYRKLVLDRQIATSANSYYDDISIGPSMFIVYAVADPDHSLAQIEKTIDQVIQSFIDEPVAAADLNRVKQNLIADAIYAQEDLKTLAYIYGQSLATGLSTDYIENWETEIEKITAHDVQEAARYVFNRNASVTGYLMKPIEQE